MRKILFGVLILLLTASTECMSYSDNNVPQKSVANQFSTEQARQTGIKFRELSDLFISCFRYVSKKRPQTVRFYIRMSGLNNFGII